MAEKKQDAGFTVTDRRLFTADGELRAEVPEEKPVAEPAPDTTVTTAPAEAAPSSIGRPRHAGAALRS